MWFTGAALLAMGIERLSPELQPDLAALVPWADDRPVVRVPDAVASRDAPEAVEQWIDEEVLLREARLAAPPHAVPLSRPRLVQWMIAVLEAGVVLETPTPAELRAFHDAHQERYASTLRYDLEVLRPPEHRDEVALEERLARLRLGAPLSEKERRALQTGGFMRRSAAARTFGLPVAAALSDLEPGRWTRVDTPEGALFVRLTGTHPSGPPRPYAEVSARVARDLRHTRVATAVRAEIARMRARYRVVRP